MKTNIEEFINDIFVDFTVNYMLYYAKFDYCDRRPIAEFTIKSRISLSKESITDIKKLFNKTTLEEKWIDVLGVNEYATCYRFRFYKEDMEQYIRNYYLGLIL